MTCEEIYRYKQNSVTKQVFMSERLLYTQVQDEECYMKNAKQLG